MIFKIIPGNQFIWNRDALLDYLIEHQGQTIELSTNKEGCCCTSIGLYHLLDQFKFEDVIIHTSNPLETHDKYQIKIKNQWEFLKVVDPIDPSYHTWTGNKTFLTLYGRPLWHRIGFASYLKSCYDNISAVGFLSDCRDQNTRSLYELNDLFVNDMNSIKYFAQAVDYFPAQIDRIDEYTPGQCNTDGYVDQTKQIYPDILIDVVAETFTSGNCLFITEKTVRPILLKKPMIVMGSKNYLDYLHQMGFRTFSDFWNEDYDGFEGANRFNKILKLLDELAKKSNSELEEMYLSMTYTLDHNYELLLSQRFKKHVRYID